jgi:hypothetical protein
MGAAHRPAEPPANRPPQPSLAVQPRGVALAQVTRVTFLALASDPDGDSATFEWDFGDGSAATGASVERVFATPGVYTVRLNAKDPHGATASTSTTVTVGTLDGVWVPNWCTGDDCNTRPTLNYDCVQQGQDVQCRAAWPRESYQRIALHLSHPRTVSGRIIADETTPGRPLPPTTNCSGDVLPDLKSLECFGTETARNFALRRP